MKRLRIAYILPGFCANEDDWCIPVLTNLVKEMAQRTETVVYPLYYPFRRESYMTFGAVVHGMSRRKQRGVGRLMLWRELEQRIVRHHRQRPFDLIHGFWATETGFLATHIARRLSIPSVVSLAGGELARLEEFDYGTQRSFLGRRLVLTSLTKATTVTAGSEWLANLAPQSVRSKLTVLPLGVDTKMYAPGGIRYGKRLLAAASFSLLKDYATLLRGVAIARRSIPQLELEIAGAGIGLEHIRNLIYKLDLNDTVRLSGFLPYEEMPEAYRRADLFLHCSRYEAQGMVILEALATGLPVVASNVGIAAGLPHGLLYRFQPGDHVGLAETIVRSLSSTDHAERAFHHGPELIRREYSIQETAERFLALYQDKGLFRNDRDIANLSPGHERQDPALPLQIHRNQE